MSGDRLQVYQSGDLRVTFDPKVCMHSGVCLRTLPQVFDVNRSRWIHPEAAESRTVIAAVAKCPSGALQAQLVTSVHEVLPPLDEP